MGAVALPALDMVLSTGRPPLAAAPPGRRAAPHRGQSAPARPRWPTTSLRRIGGVMIPMGRPAPRSPPSCSERRGLRPRRRPVRVGLVRARCAVALASGLHASRLNGDPLALRRVRCLATRSDGVPPGVRRRPCSTSPRRSTAPTGRGTRGACRVDRRRPGHDRTPPHEEAGFCTLRPNRPDTRSAGRSQMARTLAACSPLGPWFVSNSTFWPSSRLR